MVNGPIRIEDNSADQSPSISLANKHKDCKSGDQSTARVLVNGPIRIEDNSADQSQSISLANKHKDCYSADQSELRRIMLTMQSPSISLANKYFSKDCYSADQSKSVLFSAHRSHLLFYSADQKMRNFF